MDKDNIFDFEKELDKLNIPKDVFTTIRLCGLTEQINMNKDDLNHAIGMGILFYSNNKLCALRDELDINKLNDNTILYFKPNAIKTSIEIIHGALLLLNTNNIIEQDPDEYIDSLLDYLCTHQYIRYKKFLESINRITFKDDKYQWKFGHNMDFILDNVWFMTYAQIDEISNEIKEEFENSAEKKNE